MEPPGKAPLGMLCWTRRRDVIPPLPVMTHLWPTAAAARIIVIKSVTDDNRKAAPCSGESLG